MVEPASPIARARATAVTPSMLAPALATLDLSGARRHGLGLFLRHLALGERVAQRSATRQALLAPDARATRFLRSQARHEAMHARIFDTAAAALGVSAPDLPDCPYAAFDSALEAAARRGDYADTVLGTQVVLEALGDTLLQRLDDGLQRHRAGLAGLRRLLRAQEASHHAFGVAEMVRLSAVHPGGASALARCVPHYRRLAGRMIDAGAPALRAFDLTPADIGNELDLRLAREVPA